MRQEKEAKHTGNQLPKVLYSKIVWTFAPYSREIELKLTEMKKSYLQAQKNALFSSQWTWLDDGKVC